MFTIGICNVCGHWPLRLPGLYLVIVLLLLLGNNTKIMINITNAALFWYLVYVVHTNIHC